ncbi:thioesterase II family protein [Trinickia diaoshuihuensis]|uniref:thioesterase II family protein n=1 Tax=Trinickia diaoshuihuensis TaxID=2292265 RepID=UPI000E2573A8|nr:alpha/beta fold hydrolase [Trinickia diaoshuihuensis]
MNDPQSWLPVINQCESPIARLVCIPYSGGDIHAYRPWAALMPAGIELRAVQLPGRGKRLNEPQPTDLTDVAACIASAIEQLDPLPLVLFGHSMGAALCYETVCRLEKGGKLEHLKHVFLSGGRSPDHHARKPVAEHDVSDDEIRERLLRYQGTPLELLENKDLFDLFLPILRGDFRMMAGYRPVEMPVIQAPVTVFSGIDEQITAKQLDAWSVYAGGYFSKFRFDGGHFFIHSARPRVIKRIFQEVEATTGFRRWRHAALPV